MERLYDRIYRKSFIASTLTLVILCGFGMRQWPYKGQWITAVLNVAVWSFFLLYIMKNKNELKPGKSLLQPLYLMIIVMLVLMQVSRHE